VIKVLVDGSAYVVGLFAEGEVFQHGEICDKLRLSELINAFPDRQVYLETRDESLLDEVYFMLPHIRGASPVKIVSKLDSQKELDYWLVSSYGTVKKRAASKLIALISIGVILGSILLLPISSEYRSTVLATSQLKLDNYAPQDPSLFRTLDLSSLYTFVQYTYNALDVESISFVGGKATVIFSSDKASIVNQPSKLLSDATLIKVDTRKIENGSIVYFYKLEGSYDRVRAR
jgi:hypothetical protein